MQRNQVEELYRELDATREDFVRQKFAVGGYAGWKVKHVRTWLTREDDAAKARHTASVRFWTMVAGVGAIGAVVVAVIGLLLK